MKYFNNDPAKIKEFTDRAAKELGFKAMKKYLNGNADMRADTYFFTFAPSDEMPLRPFAQKNGDENGKGLLFYLRTPEEIDDFPDAPWFRV